MTFRMPWLVVAATTAMTIATITTTAVTATPALAYAHCTTTTGVVPAGYAVPADLSSSDQDSLRVVAAAIWGQDLANGWDMNSAVADVLSSATQAILDCSQAFSLVPRPPGWVPGVAYLVKYALNLRDYFLVLTTNRTYQACVSGAALNYRSAMDIASLGL